VILKSESGTITRMTTKMTSKVTMMMSIGMILTVRVQMVAVQGVGRKHTMVDEIRNMTHRQQLANLQAEVCTRMCFVRYKIVV
jgi:hypothetical protein